MATNITIAAATTTRLATVEVPTARFTIGGPEASPLPNTGLTFDEGADLCPTASASLFNAAGIPSAGTSIHCESDRKYSSAGLKLEASTRNAMICLCLEAARSTSLPTCDDAMALPDNTSTKALASLIARTMASAYTEPGFTSRGAIQHDTP